MSRDSEYDGYWLMGFLISEPGPWSLELLAGDTACSPDTPAGTRRESRGIEVS